MPTEAEFEAAMRAIRSVRTKGAKVHEEVIYRLTSTRLRKIPGTAPNGSLATPPWPVAASDPSLLHGKR